MALYTNFATEFFIHFSKEDPSEIELDEETKSYFFWIEKLFSSEVKFLAL